MGGGTGCSNHLTWEKDHCSADLEQLPSILQRENCMCQGLQRIMHMPVNNGSCFLLVPTFLGIGVCQHLEIFAISTKDVCRSILTLQ